MPARPLPVAIALVVALTGCARVGGEVLQGSQNGALPLAAGQSLGQTFAPAGDRLAGVDVTSATYGRSADGRFTAQLRDAADGRVLATAGVRGRDVADNGWTALRFDRPVPAPALAMVELRWDGTEPIGVYANVPPEPGADRGSLSVTAPGAGTAPPLENDPYVGGTLLRDGARAPGDLAFRVVGTGGPRAAAVTVTGTLGGVLAGLASAPVFAVLWLAALAGCAVLALRGLGVGGGRSGRTAPGPGPGPAAAATTRPAGAPDGPAPAPPARATRPGR